MQRYEAKLLVLIAGVVYRILGIRVRRGIVNAARENETLTSFLDKANRVVLVAALSAEVKRIQPLVWIAW